MPIKSKAQRRKFAELLVKGEISAETFEEWNRGAGSAELPERLHPKVAAKRKRRSRATTRPNPKPKRRAKAKVKAASKRASRTKKARVKKGGRPSRQRA